MTDPQAAQAAIEEEALNLGIARYRKEQEKEETSTRPGKRLLNEALVPCAQAIQAWVDDVTSGKPTPQANLGYFLQAFDPHVVAWIVAKRVINSMVKRDSLQSVALAISKHLEDAVNFDALKNENPRAYKLLQKKLAHSSAAGHRHVVMRKQMQYAGVRAIKWETNQKVALGVILIDLLEASVFINGSPLFQRELQPSSGGRGGIYILSATATLTEWLEKSHEHCEVLEPMHMPMVVKPRVWTTVDDGGYLNPKLQYALIKTRNRKAYLEELRHVDMPKVYAAVNLLQETPYRINAGVHRVMREAWESNTRINKMPQREPLPLPPDAPADCTAEELASVKAAKAQVYAANIRLMSKRIGMGTKMWLAEKYSKFDRIYFPHALDWRGRAYPVANYLHPQADDTGKALLEFADGVELGDNGAYWLAVHGANCYGVDKLSFDDRVQWVLDNEDAILESAANPLDGSMFWAKTEEAPWKFLAFCFEWAGYVMSGRSDNYKSHLPVAFDGSCNGLQNYSMMLRDEVGGAATNLIPSEKPSDIYTLVANELSKVVEQDAKKGVPGAAPWVGKVIRKITKQPTMTMPYGAGAFGYRAQILDALAKLKEESGIPYLGTADEFKAANYLATAIKHALGSVVVKAAQAMDWLQVVSRIAAEDGLPVRWTSPCGLPVVQDYREMEGTRIKVEVAGQRVDLTINVEGTKLDRRRQAQGIAPNFIHSLDAAHMMSTAVLCGSTGVTSLSMVHDSFAAHAGHADKLCANLREAFVEQYSQDILGEFVAVLQEQLPAKLSAKIPSPPERGNLDPQSVLDSQYFFA